MRPPRTEAELFELRDTALALVPAVERFIQMATESDALLAIMTLSGAAALIASKASAGDVDEESVAELFTTTLHLFWKERP